MCCTISLAASKPCNIRESNAKFEPRKSKISRLKAEVSVAPRKQRSSIPVFPELTKAGISLTNLRVREVVKRQSQSHIFGREDQSQRKPKFHPSFLEEAYERCRKICAEYAKSFYLGRLLSSLWLDFSINGKKFWLSLIHFESLDCDPISWTSLLHWCRYFANDRRKKKSHMGNLWQV